jgi:hypothetical protein
MVAQLSVLAKGRAQRPVENCSWAIRLPHVLWRVLFLFKNILR